MSEEKRKLDPFLLTAEQKRETDALEKMLLKNHVTPLMEDAEHQHPGWSNLNIVDRFHVLSNLNEKYIGKGECLPVICPNYELAWFQAYSGMGVSFDWSVFDGKIGGILPLQFSEHSVTQTTHGARFILASNKFRELPVAFRVAVIAEYVLENTTIGYSEAFAFAMGSGGLKTYRIMIAPKVSLTTDLQTKRLEGWTIHISDTRPSNEQLLAIGRLIRSYDEVILDQDTRNPHIRNLTEVHDSFDHRKARRSGNAKVREMVLFVDNLIASGKNPKRGGNCTWRDVWCLLMKKRPELVERYSTPEALMQSYSQYKRRQKLEEIEENNRNEQNI